MVPSRFGALATLLLVTLAAPVHAAPAPARPVVLRVDQIDVHLLANGDTRVDVRAHVANGSLAPLRELAASFSVQAAPGQPAEDLAVAVADELAPLGSKTFSLSHTFIGRQVMRPLVRPRSLSYKMTRPLRVADWLLGAAAPQLQRAGIPAGQALADVRHRRQAALAVLRAVPAGDPDYAEAKRKQAQILYVWALELRDQGRRAEAAQLLQQLEPGNPYAADARKLLQ